MNDIEVDSINFYKDLLNQLVDYEELQFYLSEAFCDYTRFLEDSASVHEMLLITKHEPNAFQKICTIISEQCLQGFLIDRLKEYVDSHTTETDSVQPPSDIVCSETVHSEFCNSILQKILNCSGTRELCLHGPSGSGKTFLLNKLMSMLTSHGYSSHIINFKVKRFSSIVSEIQSITTNKSVIEKYLLILDGCSQSEVNRLKDGENNMVAELMSKQFDILYVPRNMKTLIVSESNTFSMPKCNEEQLMMIIKARFPKINCKDLEEIIPIHIKHPYPLHAILTVSLFSIGKSMILFKKNLPKDENEEVFIMSILTEIFRVQENCDNLYVLVALQVLENINNITTDLIRPLVNDHIKNIETIQKCLYNLIEAGFVLSDQDKDTYCVCSNFSQQLPFITQSSSVWNNVVHKFCSYYLKYTSYLIDIFINENKSSPEIWESHKKVIIRSLTYPINHQYNRINFLKVAHLRFVIASRIRPVWQARIISREDAVDIYESVLSLIKDITILESEDRLLLYSLKRTILIHYISLFFYLNMINEHSELVENLFIRFDEAIKILSDIPGYTFVEDDLYYEFLSLIIDFEIYEGNIEVALKNIKILMDNANSIHNPSISNFLSTKIKLAQVQLLANQSVPTLTYDEESVESSPAGTSSNAYIYRTQIRISRGDGFYLKKDFISAALNYKFALLGLQDISSKKLLVRNERNNLEQDIRLKIGVLKLQYGSERENKLALEEFKKCQQLHGSLESNRKNYKYIVYIWVCHLLLKDSTKALACATDFLKYFTNKKVLIGITSINTQEMISKNIQERLTGPELKHIDNHVYQGKVNFLHLAQDNFNWVKHQITDEIIEVYGTIEQKKLRMDVLNFSPPQMDSNKCLVVVFLESQHHRTRSNSTNFSGMTPYSLSSFNTDIVATDGGVSPIQQPEATPSVIDSVFSGSVNFAKDVMEKAKYDLLTKITTSIFDKFL